MNKDDEYCFVLQKAILQPINSNRNFFLDNLSQKVFSLKFNGDEWLPHHRNVHIEPTFEKREFFQKMINSLKTGNANIIELKPVSTSTKLSFLTEFVTKYVLDQDLKNLLQKELQNFDDNSECSFAIDLRSINKQVYTDFEREVALFGFEKIKVCYTFFDINNVLDVVW